MQPVVVTAHAGNVQHRVEDSVRKLMNCAVAAEIEMSARPSSTCGQMMPLLRHRYAVVNAELERKIALRLPIHFTCRDSRTLHCVDPIRSLAPAAVARLLKACIAVLAAVSQVVC